MDFEAIRVSSQWIPSALVAIGIVLIILVLVAWFRSNRAEATPNAEQREEIRRFVERDFARYAARGLAAAGNGAVLTPNLATDPGWRKVFVHHLELQSELRHLTKSSALAIYTIYIDAAVQRELAALGAVSAPTASEDIVDGVAPS